METSAVSILITHPFSSSDKQWLWPEDRDVAGALRATQPGVCEL